MCEHKVKFLDVVNYTAMNKGVKMPLKCEKCGCDLYPEEKSKRILSGLAAVRIAAIVVILLLYLYVQFSLAVLIGVLVLYCLLELGAKYLLWRRMKYRES